MHFEMDYTKKVMYVEIISSCHMLHSLMKSDKRCITNNISKLTSKDEKIVYVYCFSNNIFQLIIKWENGMERG